MAEGQHKRWFLENVMGYQTCVTRCTDGKRETNKQESVSSFQWITSKETTENMNCLYRVLTLQCSRCCVPRCTVSGQEDPYMNQTHQKLTFPNEFLCWNLSHCYSTPKTQKQLKIDNPTFSLKMAAKNPIEILGLQLFCQKWENHFPDGIFPYNLAHK